MATEPIRDPSSPQPTSAAPYRDPAEGAPPGPPPPAPRTTRVLGAARWRRVGVGLVAVGLASLVIARAYKRAVAPGLSDAPPELLSNARFFPALTDDLPPATPLAPLLAADEPEQLAVLEPREGATRVSRGEPLTVRFNRPMVPASAVGRPVTAPVLRLDPPVPGTLRWTTRSALAFEPAATAWDRTHESRLEIDRQLTSLAGETLLDETPRTVVFDGTAHLDSGRIVRRVLPGEPLRLVFDGPMQPAGLASQLMAYESGGGRRALGFSLAPGGRDADGRTFIDVRLARALEPGAQVALAVAPTLLSESEYGSPEVLSFELRPRSRVEGIACAAGASSADDCEFRQSPGRVVDIQETLRLYTSVALAPLGPGAVTVSPALAGMTASAEGNVLSVRGDWEPGQVYEVRFGALRDTEGTLLARTPPLAVRSAGRPSEVQAPSGRFAYERDDRRAIRFAGVHVERGAVRLLPIARGMELRAALAPHGDLFAAPELAQSVSAQELRALLPGARANRWARGEFGWRDALAQRGADDDMALVAFVPDTDPSATGVSNVQPTAFVQATDLGVTARAVEHGVLVWVTSLATAAPVRGASVTVQGANSALVGTAQTDADGLAFVPHHGTSLDSTLAVRAVSGRDRAVVVLDPRTAIGPGALSLAAGDAAGAQPAGADVPVASVMTDRGAYRPGERLRARVVVRTVHGDALRAVTRGAVRVRRVSPEGVETDSSGTDEVRARLSAFGTADVEFTLERQAPLGEHRIEVFRTDRRGNATGTAIGFATFTVAEFRQPTFRVDLAVPAGEPAEGDALAAGVNAAYLFGAAAANARARWSLLRDGVAEMPARWDQYVFTPVDAAARNGTIDSGELTLDPRGAAPIASHLALGVPVRQRATLEVEVRDSSGQATTARRSFTAYPAAFEIGVHGGPNWVALGSALDLDAMVIAHDGTPAAGRAVEARIVREGWHTYWEWSEHARDDAAGAAGGYQARRTREAEVVTRCALRSLGDGAPVHCAFTPSRPGTYVLEASTRDDQGRTAVASRRLYVAGPGEHPDRDPPGAPIALTPSRRDWFVGETARVAVESPWADAEALFTVEREGVIRAERRRLHAGGNVFEIPVTREMVPNAFVSLVLVRPRTGAPAGEVDLGAPDLRVGAAELSVRPQSTPLAVAIALPQAQVLPGTEVPVEVTVRDSAGRPAHAEVALYAVDEGTLRLTGYTTPDPTAGLYPRRAPAFAMEDLRRALVARTELPALPAAGGDGGDASGSGAMRENRERFEPTPLWAPRLVTDAQGRARATFRVPERATQYRVMAVAVDTGARAGRAATALTATRPVVLRPVMPRSVVAGDRFEAATFVHNATQQALDATVTVAIAGARRAPRAVHLEPGGDARVAEWVDVPAAAFGEPIGVRIEATASNGAGGDVATAAVPVRPRGRVARSEQVGGVTGGHRELEVAMPPGALGDGGEATLVVARHPFVGLGSAAATLAESPYDGVDALASTVLGLAAYEGLVRATPHAMGAASRAATRARGSAAVARLAEMQTRDGGFAQYTAADNPLPYASAFALRALEAAARAGFEVPAGVRERAREYVARAARDTAYLDELGGESHDALALALRALRDAGEPDAARVTALFEQRSQLSPFGLAQLALAMEPRDRRRDALVLAAERRVLATREDERTEASLLRWYDSSSRTYAAVLEAASQVDVGYREARRLASQLLRLRAGEGGAGWGSAHETGHALAGLAAYAARFREAPGPALAPRVRLDGAELAAAERTEDAVLYRLPFARLLTGKHRVRIDSERAAFFALGARWVVALGPLDEVARGREVALHRVFETEAGAPLAPGAHVRLGEMLRVRLFVYAENDTPPALALRDPLGGGFDAVDAGLETSPHASLDALLGGGADDGAIDPRGYHARRSLDLITYRAFAPAATTFYLAHPTPGLHEFTYAVRATAVGTFTLPPAQLEALYTPSWRARSTAATLVVDP